MNREKPIRDQAERLRRRVERKTDQAVERKETLPPRSEVHRQKQKKTNVKVKYPVIRLMALFFILLPVTFFSIITYLEGAKGPLGSVADRAGIEMIDVENGNQGVRVDQDESEEEEDVPAVVGKSDSDQIDLAAGPAPESTGDKDTDALESKEASSQERENTEPGQGTQTNTEEGTPEAEGKVLYHTVQPNETLFRVAMKYYKSQDGIPIIQKANNLQGNEIQAGQVLKIPVQN